MQQKVTIEKLIFGGQGLARDEGKAIMAWNVLAGETAEILLTKNKKSFAEGVAVNITTPSVNRLAAREEHFLSCSPWQILSWPEELKWKQLIAQEVFDRASLSGLEFSIAGDEENQYGYRNKMEYSFTTDSSGEISLAFFQRGQHKLQAIPGCLLASPAISQTANKVVSWLKANKISAYSVKSLIIRSNNQGQTIAALFVKDKISYSGLPELDKTCLGFYLYYSTPQSPASVPTELLDKTGQSYLITEIQNCKLKYGLLSFFQVNEPIFIAALDDISQFIPADCNLVDFYSGVGAISLPLAAKVQDLILVESNQEAVRYAEENIQANNIAKAKAVLSTAEEALKYITENSTVIFDPPRPGLHPDVIKHLLAVKPPRIIYLSCDIATQSRDIKLLEKDYQIKFNRLYNFFPRTPHIESLVVLEKL